MLPFPYVYVIRGSRFASQTASTGADSDLLHRQSVLVPTESQQAPPNNWNSQNKASANTCRRHVLSPNTVPADSVFRLLVTCGSVEWKHLLN